MPAAPLCVRRMKQFPHGLYWVQACGLVFQSLIQSSVWREVQQAGLGFGIEGGIFLHLVSVVVVLLLGTVGAAILLLRRMKLKGTRRDMLCIAIAVWGMR